MARGRIPAQAPAVPQELFFAINDIYLYLRALDDAVTALETGPSGTFTTVDGKTITVVNGRVTSIV